MSLRKWWDIGAVIPVLVLGLLVSCSDKKAEPPAGSSATGGAAVTSGPDTNMATQVARPRDGGDGTVSLQGLSIPLEYHSNGTIRVNLMARTAKANPEGDDILAQNVRYEVFKPDGMLDVLVMADECRYRKAAGKAGSNSRVRLERAGVIITGEGFELDATNQIVTVHTNVVVVLEKGVDFRWKKE